MRSSLRILITLIISLIAIAPCRAQYRNALKATVLSWTTGSAKIFYERHTGGIHTDQVALGYIGCTYDGKHNNPKGLIMRYGHKFNLALRNDDKPLQGLYVQPEMIYVNFKYNPKDGSERTRSEMFTLMSIIGYQFVYKRFVFDYFTGPGIVAGTEADIWYEHSFTLWEYFGTRNRKISYTMGFKVGVAF